MRTLTVTFFIYISILVLHISRRFTLMCYYSGKSLLVLDWGFSIQLGTIHILHKHVLGDFLTHPPTIWVLLVSKKGRFLNPPIQSNAYVIYEWSLSELSLFAFDAFSIEYVK